LHQSACRSFRSPIIASACRVEATVGSSCHAAGGVEARIQEMGRHNATEAEHFRAIGKSPCCCSEGRLAFQCTLAASLKVKRLAGKTEYKPR
jgi:hypothetical protein